MWPFKRNPPPEEGKRWPFNSHVEWFHAQLGPRPITDATGLIYLATQTQVANEFHRHARIGKIIPK